jgi:hypothetical protein
MKSQLSQAKSKVVRLSVALTSAIVLSGLFSPQSIANDVQVAPANCVAPYLDQAFPMRWHENYLMNPTSNIATWVICPMDLDVDVLPVGFVAFVTGGIMSGASGELPSCFFTVNSAVNLLQPPFIPGPAAIYTLSMQVDTGHIPDLDSRYRRKRFGCLRISGGPRVLGGVHLLQAATGVRYFAAPDVR